MKNIIDFILESRGQRISQRAGNRPYNPKYDELLKKRDSRPERAQKLRETKLDKQVQEFCSALVNDFMVKFYKLTASNQSLLSFYSTITNTLKNLDKNNKLNNIKPCTDRTEDGCIFLQTVENKDTDDEKVKRYILKYNKSDSFTTILNNLEIYYKSYHYDSWGDRRIDYDDEYHLYIEYKSKFFASVLHKLRKHDLAKKAAEGTNLIDLFELLNDFRDNYNKNYFADKFKEFESAYNDVLANW